MAQNSFTDTQHNSTENRPKEEEKKDSKFSIDHDYDFIFLKNWPPIVRWLLVIPAGFLSLLLTQFALGFVVNMIQKSFDSYYVSLIIDGIFMIIKFMIFEITIVGVAPVKRSKKFLTGIILSIIPIGMMLLMAWGLTLVNQNPEAYNTYYPTTTIIVQIITGLLGIIWALFSIRNETSKKTEVLEKIEEIGKTE